MRQEKGDKNKGQSSCRKCIVDNLERAGETRSKDELPCRRCIMDDQERAAETRPKSEERQGGRDASEVSLPNLSISVSLQGKAIGLLRERR